MSRLIKIALACAFLLAVPAYAGAATFVNDTFNDGAPVSPFVNDTFDDSGDGPQPNGPAGAWSIVFDDEFSGSSMDTTQWSPQEGGTTNGVTTHASNITETGGNLVLQLASSTSGAEACTCDTTGDFRLEVGDYAEARVYFPGTSTQHIYNWPAWWASGPSWPAAGEHDIAEGLGDGGSGSDLTINYHGTTNSANYGAPSGTWYNAFHTYGVRRNASTADVYWDGVLKQSYSTGDNGVGESLILNVGVSGSRTAVTGASGAMKVDYVRVWTPA